MLAIPTRSERQLIIYTLLHEPYIRSFLFSTWPAIRYGLSGSDKVAGTEGERSKERFSFLRPVGRNPQGSGGAALNPTRVWTQPPHLIIVIVGIGIPLAE